MKIIITRTVLVLIGIVIGWYCSWVYSYLPKASEVEVYIDFEEIFKYSNVEITNENNSCNGNNSKTVGEVLGSIFQPNMGNKRNKVSLLCYENKCGLYYNYCMPWQSQECGSRILRFDLDENKKIITKSFVCVDAP